jgi:tetratricopeptide (TPR) repeat protein
MLRALFLAGLFCLSFPLAAQTVAPCAGDAPCAQRLSAVDVFALADRYIAAGQPDDAETLYRGLVADPNDDIRAEARFRLALLRESRGSRQDGIDLLRALLDEKPDAGRVRLELARMLALQGDESGARRELRRAGAAGLPDDVSRAVDQFAMALRSSRPVGGTVEVALAPDSNINRATDSETVDTVLPGGPAVLDPDARARSGIGVALSGQGFWRADLSDRTAILTRLSARAELYGESRFNDVVLSLASGPEFQAAGARWRPAAVATRRWFGGDRYSDSLGGSLNVLKPINRVSQVEVEATVLSNRYRLVPSQNGTLVDVNAAYDRAFTPKFSGRIGLRFTRQSAREEALSTTSGAIEAVLSRQIGRQIVFVQAGASRLESDARLNLFPKTRRDTRYDATLGVVLRQWQFRGLAPLVRITRSVNQSTVGIYDFKRTRVEFALSREF